MSEESPLRTLGAIGDIHCEAEALGAALRFLKKAKVDRVLAVGDIVDGGGSADDCCRLLQEFNVVTVRGNHERWFLRGEMRDLPDATFKAGSTDARDRGFTAAG